MDDGVEPLKVETSVPHPAQRRVLDEAARFNVVACGRRWGKTQMSLEHLAIPAALIENQPVGWFAPTYKLLSEVWSDAARVLAPLGKLVKYNKVEWQIRMPHGGVLDFWTMKSSTSDRSQAGRGRKYKLVVIDEAAHAPYLDVDWTRSIRPTLSDLRGSAWFPSTPWGQNYFYQLFVKGQTGEKDWASWQMPTAENPYIDPEELDDARAMLPKDAWEQEYEAKFLSDAASPFGAEAIRRCIQTEPVSGPAVVWGVDLAKARDWTVAIGLNARGDVCEFHRWQTDWMMTTERLADLIGFRPAIVDSTGVGDPVVELLQRRCRQVEGRKFSLQSKQQMMEGLALAIQRGEVSYPDGEIVHELNLFRFEYGKTGVRYCAPSDANDDCVDALALAVQCLRGKPQEVRLDIGEEVDEMRSEAWVSQNLWSEFLG